MLAFGLKHGYDNVMWWAKKINRTTSTEAVASLTELLRSTSPAQRMQFLCEAVQLCAADDSLDKPLKVTEDSGPVVGYVISVLPRTTTPFPELTQEEEAELERRIDDRKNAVFHEEFLASVRELIYASRRIRRTKTPLPELTDGECAELQRGIDNRQGIMSEKEFVAEIRKRIKQGEKDAITSPKR